MTLDTAKFIVHYCERDVIVPLHIDFYYVLFVMLKGAFIFLKALLLKKALRAQKCK